MEKYFKILQQTDLFRDFSENELKDIFSKTETRIFSYEKGQNLFIRREHYPNLYILLKGGVKMESWGADARIIQIRTVNAPDIIAPFYVFGSRNYFPFNLIASQNISLLKIPKENVLDMLQKNRRVLKNYLKLTSDRFIFLANKMEFLHFNTISKKLAYYLLDLKENDKGEIKLPLSITELSEYFGVERPSLSKILGQFVKEGLIISKSRRILKILDRERLIKKIH